MKDLIWLSHFIPYPARGGAAQRSYNLLRQAASRYRVTLVAFNRPRQSEDELAASRRAFESLCHRVEFFELPFPWRGCRWWLRLVLAGWEREPISVRAYDGAEVRRRWRELLSQNPGALLHIDSSDLACFIDDTEGSTVVLNHHNCESEMLRRRVSLERSRSRRWVLRNEMHRQKALEERLLHRVAMNVAVSGVDAEALQATDRAARIRVVENGTDTGYFQPQGQPEDNTIVFAGSLRWHPNQSGLRWFDREVWPELKARSAGVRFIVTGQKPPEFLVRWAHSDPQIEFVPDPEDIRPLIARGAVYVCPIRDGGGSRLKLLDAMAMGKAIVSTAVGAEGLRVRSGEQMLIADAPQEFARQVLALLHDARQRENLQAAARQFAVEEYGWEKIGRSLLEAYAEAENAAGGKEHGASW